MSESDLDAVLLEQLLHQILPAKPLLTSKDGGLKNIFLAHYQHDAWELPEHTVPLHVLEIICQNANIPHKRRIGDRVLCEPLTGGELFFCPANTDHSIRWEETMNFTLLAFHPRLLEVEFGCSPEAVFPLVNVFDPHIQSLVNAIKADLAAGCPLGSVYSDAQALALAAQLVKRLKLGNLAIGETSDGLPKQKLADVQAFVQWKIELAENPSLSEMATVAGMSQYHFCRLFKQSTGVSPGKYANQQRIERAKQLLISTHYSVTEIALRCGFSPRQFNNLFKQMVNLSPSAFRQEFRP